MDFAAQLANLEQSAARAARSGNSRTNSDSNRRRDRTEANHPNSRNQRPRHDKNGGWHHGQSEVSSLKEMKRMGYRVDEPAWTPKSDRSLPHICLLAITIQDLPYEHIWRAWANAAQEVGSKCNFVVSLVCHAKYPNRVQSDWLRQRLLRCPPRRTKEQQAKDSTADIEYHTRVPAWGSVNIARAMMDCLSDAVQIGNTSANTNNATMESEFSRYIISHPSTTQSSEATAFPTVDKFIFISESCLPVTTLRECIEELFPVPQPIALEPDSLVTNNISCREPDNDAAISKTETDPWDISWVNARSRNTPGTPCNKYERDQFSNIQRFVPDNCRWKADQWLLLSRRHALAILQLDGKCHPAHPSLSTSSSLDPPMFWTAFAKVNASDEMYFPTALAVLLILTDTKDTNLVVDGKNETQQRCDHESDHEKVSSPNQSSVALRAVTYTAWTEGMRNPACFIHGPRDFRTVAILARQHKCLFARKFAMQGPLEGSSVTGEITAEEWHDILSKVSDSKPK